MLNFFAIIQPTKLFENYEISKRMNLKLEYLKSQIGFADSVFADC
jgi:hypothetical protein